jgi:pSer/pThr/pTyr-binding forkhead associated (FHA) protein
VSREIILNGSTNSVFDSLEGRTFIIGREGHIYISDPAASKEHAEMRISDGRIRIRDLGSTNGIYVMKDNKAMRFKEDYVEPHQTIAIGEQKQTVHSLLAIVGAFAS